MMMAVGEGGGGDGRVKHRRSTAEIRLLCCPLASRSPHCALPSPSLPHSLSSVAGWSSSWCVRVCARCVGMRVSVRVAGSAGEWSRAAVLLSRAARAAPSASHRRPRDDISQRPPIRMGQWASMHGHRRGGRAGGGRSARRSLLCSVHRAQMTAEQSDDAVPVAASGAKRSAGRPSD